MSDFGSSPAKEIEIDADGEAEGLLKKSSSPELVDPRVSRWSEDTTKGDKAHGGDRRQGKKQHPKSPSTSASCSRSSDSSRSRSRSRDYKAKRRLSRSSSGSSQHEHKRSTSGHNCRKVGDYDRHTNNRPSHNGRNSSPVAKRKQGFGDRDNPSPSRCVGVFGLSLYTQERLLWEVFGRCGHINEVQVVYDRQTGRSRGFAFIYFKSTDSAFEAKQCCDGMEIDGRKIRVDFSITEGPHPPTPGVYLGRRYCADRADRRPAPYQRCGPSYCDGYRHSYSPDRKYY